MGKRKQEPVKHNIFKLAKGCRTNLHPCLSVLDSIDSEVWYDKSKKFIYVEYDRDVKTGKFKKSIMTPSINSVEEEIKDFIKERYEIDGEL